jgi:hypothetical protein
MKLEEFWATTPGEVALVIYAAAERNLDQLELGVHQVWLGRVVSRMKKPDPRIVLPRRRSRSGKAPVDEAFTASEAARWRRYFADQERMKAGNA